MSYYDPKELKDGEMFLGNTDAGEDLSARFPNITTIRKGKQAFDIFGKKLDPLQHLPLFIHKSEYHKYDKIMTSKV